MHLVVVKHKNKLVLSDLTIELYRNFPTDVFSIHGSEEKGYDLWIEGVGDEKAPRKFAEDFIKKWNSPVVEKDK